MTFSNPPSTKKLMKRANVKSAETENILTAYLPKLLLYIVKFVSLFRHFHASQREFMVSPEFVKYDFHLTFL
jgi:predicted choloylglycine hydrolase